MEIEKFWFAQNLFNISIFPPRERERMEKKESSQKNSLIYNSHEFIIVILNMKGDTAVVKPECLLCARIDDYLIINF